MTTGDSSLEKQSLSSILEVKNASHILLQWPDMASWHQLFFRRRTFLIVNNEILEVPVSGNSWKLPGNQ